MLKYATIIVLLLSIGSVALQEQENHDASADGDKRKQFNICFFEPNTNPLCKPDENGNCPDDMVMNEDGNCHPGGSCPPGFSRVDDDETGTCFDDDDLQRCPDNSIRHEDEECPS